MAEDQEKEKEALDALIKTYDKVVAHWNKAEYDELAELCDANIILKKVDDSDSIVGIGNVLVYLNKLQKPKKPQFLADQVLFKRVSRHYTLGQVSGTAEYTDNSTRPGHGEKPRKPPMKVRFTFILTRASSDEKWLVANAFAVPM